MMKKATKIISVLLSMSMLLSMSFSVSATEDDNKLKAYYAEGEEVTTVGKEPEGESERYTFTEEELQDMQRYYEEHASEIAQYGHERPWDRVSNIRTKPYKSIAHLTLRYTDGSIEYGTGAAVGDGVILTAAHCVVDKKANENDTSKLKVLRKVDIKFARDATTYENPTSSTEWYTSPEWDDLIIYDPHYDYAVILVDPAITRKTGTLSCSSVLPDSTEEFTMAGYPWEKGNAAYDGLKCYTDTGNFMKFYEGKKTSFEHDINCAPGDSGAPVYRDYGDDWVVRGIHSGGFIGQGGVAKTIDSNVLNLIKKHEQ